MQLKEIDMEPTYPAGSGTVAAVNRHPLHPMLVPLPIGFLVGALIGDIMFIATGDPFWARGAFWLLVGGVITGLGAGLVGLVDLLGVARARRLIIAWVHGVGNILALVLAFINVVLRWSDYGASADPTGLVLSIAVVLILLVTGWLGGELSYRHGIGVSEAIGSVPPDSTRQAD
jgi:uncharacterized membrane protein